MFANTFQSGFVSIFYSVGSNPLSLWDKQVKNGHIRRIIDDEVKSLVLEVAGTNVATTYITCPIKPRASLGIKLPFFVMVIKNLKKYFTFEIQILDDKDMRRRFRVSNFQSTTKVQPFCTTMPIGLSDGWNQVQFNLADFTKRAYGSTYLETMRVQIHANVRVRRIYFTDQLYSEDEIPNEFKLFTSGPGKRKSKKEEPSKEDAKVAGDQPTEEFPPPPSPVEESPAEAQQVPVVEETKETATEEETVVAESSPAAEEKGDEPQEAAAEDAPLESGAEEGEPTVEQVAESEAPPEAGEGEQPAVAEDAPPATEEEPPVESEPPGDEEAAPAESEAVAESPVEEPPAEAEAAE